MWRGPAAWQPGSLCPQLWVTSKPLCCYYTGRPFEVTSKPAVWLRHIQQYTKLTRNHRGRWQKWTYKNLLWFKYLESTATTILFVTGFNVIRISLVDGSFEVWSEVSALNVVRCCKHKQKPRSDKAMKLKTFLVPIRIRTLCLVAPLKTRNVFINRAIYC